MCSFNCAPQSKTLSYTTVLKGACHATVMTVGDRGDRAPTPYILLGQLPPLSPQFHHL